MTARAHVPTELTPRQRQILAVFATGDVVGAKHVARRLGISTKTVRNHLNLAGQTLGTQSVLQAVLVALRLGLLEGLDNVPGAARCARCGAPCPPAEPVAERVVTAASGPLRGATAAADGDAANKVRAAAQATSGPRTGLTGHVAATPVVLSASGPGGGT